MRLAASDVLGSLGTASVALLTVTLDSTHEGARLAAAELLGSIGSSRAAEPLIALLRTGPCAMRGPVARALGRIGDARAADPLFALVNGTDGGYTEAWREAARALIHMYKLKRVDPQSKQRFLTVRGVIMDAHKDSTDACTGHSDCGAADMGLESPL